MAVALPTESAMPNHLLDHPTLDPGADSTALDEAGFARRAALTIVWHPDLERMGHSAVLPDGDSEVNRGCRCSATGRDRHPERRSRTCI